MAHDYVGRLDFSFTELPKWRKDEEERTSKLLSDIVDFFKRYEKLPQVAKKFCTTGFAQLMTVKFVFNVNVGESVGTQTESGTQAVLEDYIERRITKQASNGSKQEAVLKANDRLVTINVYEALKQFFKLQKEMSNTGKLTVQQICEIHKILMNGLREDAGEIRKGFAYVSWNGEDHVYPEPTVAEQLFYASIDHHCKHMTQYHKKLAEETLHQMLNHLDTSSSVQHDYFLTLLMHTHLVMVMVACAASLLTMCCLVLLHSLFLPTVVEPKEEVEGRIIWRLLLSVEATGIRVQVHWLPC